MARSGVVRTVRVIEAFDGIVGDILEKCRKVIADQGSDPAQFEAARAVVYDASQEWKKYVLTDGCSVDTRISSNGPHSRVGQAMYKSIHKPAGGQFPNGIVIPIAVDGLKRGQYAGNTWQLRVG